MILEVKNVSYYYKSQRDKLILDHVSYGFECGKLYGLIFCPAADDHGMYPIWITMDNGIGHRL